MVTIDLDLTLRVILYLVAIVCCDVNHMTRNPVIFKKAHEFSRRNERMSRWAEYNKNSFHYLSLSFRLSSK